MPTILVASDAASVRRDVTSVLERPGTELIEVLTGQGAVAAAKEHAPDLMVVDMQIGSMGGMAVTLELRLEESMDTMDHVAVLMLLDRRPDVFLARRAGAEGWLVKPLDPIRLRRATSALLAGDRYEDESLQPVPVLVGPAAAAAAGGPTPA